MQFLFHFFNEFTIGIVLVIYIISEWEGHMQKLIKAFENMMVAITFAEAGEFDEAKRLSIQDQTEETTTETASLGIKATKA